MTIGGVPLAIDKPWFIHPELTLLHLMNIIYACIEQVFLNNHVTVVLRSAVCFKHGKLSQIATPSCKPLQACALLFMNGSIISRVSKPDTKIFLHCPRLKCSTCQFLVFLVAEVVAAKLAVLPDIPKDLQRAGRCERLPG